MSEYKLVATAAFGLEAVVAKELKNLGFKNLEVENGKVTYSTDVEGIIKSNLWSRCADRIHICIAEFTATSFEELFEKVKALPWEDYMPEDANFIINAKSVKSTLFSLSDIQSISEKAIIEKLKENYTVTWFSKSGAKYPVLVSILKDKVTVLLDTSGVALHKRGYREDANMAPIKETMAAALINISGWTPDKPFMDPLCGSGTIAIEAAMIGLNIAPGLGRKFLCEEWDMVPTDLWKSARKEAYSAIDYDKTLNISASDISGKLVELSRSNAEKAGVDDYITFRALDVRKLNTLTPKGTLICNPPYGERLEEKATIDVLYKDMGEVFSRLLNWSYYILTSDEDFEKNFGRKSDKNRKLYNGRIKCYYYQYFDNN